ncbi:hypothetical protein APICC_01846 [Apis cerana cerana]|uniref:Copia protein n=1 Tax=Apis cerana cerana TaxID=94128 RepID=A0A2A3E2C5_APICC|nr:hypothetical protein APICC_01846 [Apis cerana cerana]
MDEKLLLHIINYESTKDTWKKLESVYEQKSVDMLQWYSCQKESGNDVATHIVKLENFAHRLQTLKKISNQMITKI